MSERSERVTHLPPGLPRPSFDSEPDLPFWQALRDHRLLLQRCGRCGVVQHPPEVLCEACQSIDLTWVEASPFGSLFTWARMWHPAHPSLADACPYVVVVVELDGWPGIRLLGNLLDDPGGQVQVGVQLAGVFEDGPDGVTLLQWRLGRAGRV